MSTTIEDRFVLLLRDEVTGRGTWEALQRETGIAAQSWRSAYARRQKPTTAMLQALAHLFPQYAFWLMTGITDGTHGHVAPHTAQTFPERLHSSGGYTDSYFRAAIDLFKKLFKEGHVNVDDEQERMFAAERTRPLAHWWDSPLCDAAYQIARSEEYAALKTLWEKRQKELQERLDYIRHPKEPTGPMVRGGPPRSERATPILGVDTRTTHQNHWDLFYKPPDGSKPTTKFALSLLNTPPSQLTDEQVADLCSLSYTEIRDYMQYHEMDEEQVFPRQPGMVLYAKDLLTEDEAKRLRAAINKARKSHR